MKRLMAVVLVGMFAAFSSGCCGVTPMNGTLYTDLQGPVSMGNGGNSSKKGEAKATGILGVCLGDCSIEAAMKAGGITKVHHVDSKVKNILGVYAEYITVVYGE